MVRIVAASTQTAWFRQSAAISASFLGLLLLAPSAPLAAQGPLEPASSHCSGRDLIQTATVGPYLFKAYKNRMNGDGCLEVLETLHSGKIIGKLASRVVFRHSIEGMGEFRLGQPEDPARRIPGIENGTDITGRGRANMIVTNWTDGARCCFVHYVFEVDPTLWLLAKFDDGDGEGAHFADLDGNKHYYYVGNDWTFSYPTPAGSRAPSVILRFVDDPKDPGYRLAIDKMRRPGPTQDQWNKAVSDARSDFGDPGSVWDGLGSELSRNMINLIYTGNSDLAWKAVDQAWPAQRPGKDTYLSSFCAQLKTSPYWPQLKLTILNPPPACAASAP